MVVIESQSYIGCPSLLLFTTPAASASSRGPRQRRLGSDRGPKRARKVWRGRIEPVKQEIYVQIFYSPSGRPKYCKMVFSIECRAPGHVTAIKANVTD